MIKICKKCKKGCSYANSHYKLCSTCNNNRLQDNRDTKPTNTIKYIQKDNKPLRSKEKAIKVKARTSEFAPKLLNIKKSITTLEKDNIFYEECFKLSNHKCEECETILPSYFKDSDGKIIARWRYSHIIPKSIAPEHRHNTDNINHLCIECHQRWENGDKVNMKIFAKNFVLFSSFLSRLIIK
jgi:hypothetical protein